MNIPTKGLAVDGSYLKSKKQLSWQVINIESGELIYRNSIITDAYYPNNLGEFFALTRGIYFVVKRNLDLPIFSDSSTSIAWVQNGKVNTSCTDSLLLDWVKKGENYVQFVKEYVGLPEIKFWNKKSEEFGFKENSADFNYK